MAGFFEEDYATIDFTHIAHAVHTQVLAWGIAGHHLRTPGPSQSSTAPGGTCAAPA